MNKPVTILSAILLIFMSINAYSKRSFVGQIPNGSKFDCRTCHVSSQGGRRNPFGQEVGNNFLRSGNVQWGPELAMLDSDGDGFTNGEELQDPNGKWQTGDPEPGDPDLVANPGDPDSKPNTSGLIEDLINNTSIKIYPNPFFNKMTFTAVLPNVAVASAEIFDINGYPVKNIEVNNSSTNVFFAWDGRDNNSTGVPSGIYFLKVRINDIDITRKVVLTR